MQKYKKLSVIIGVLALLGLLFPIVGMAQDVEPIVPLTDDFAPFLEPRLYAVEQGATAEFRKMEWVALDEANMVLYLAMSEIGKGMSDDEGDIQLETNDCGIV